MNKQKTAFMQQEELEVYEETTNMCASFEKSIGTY